MFVLVEKFSHHIYTLDLPGIGVFMLPEVDTDVFVKGKAVHGEEGLL